MAGYSNLDRGFLIFYDWLPLLQLLDGERFKELLLALINYQRDGIQIPKFEDEYENAFAQAILPSIKRRLDGQTGGLKANKNKTNEVPTSVPTPVPTSVPTSVPIVDTVSARIEEHR